MGYTGAAPDTQPTDGQGMNRPLFNDAQAVMRGILQRIATGPELGKDIDRDEAAAGMRQVLRGEADPVQAALFLVALRMKRETDDENAGVLDALLESVRAAPVAVDDLVEIADPYDGFVRGTPASSFLPAVLAALSVPAVITGARAVGPKYGVTHHAILAATGAKVDAEPAAVAAALAEPSVGWGYLDQARAAPALHDLVELRTRMVKRTVLTTLEVLLHPLRARRTHLVTGYVHKPYPPIYLRLARQAGYASAMVVRGVEGGVVPSLSQPSRMHRFTGDGSDAEQRLDPVELGIEQPLRIAALPATAAAGEVDGEPFDHVDTDAVAAHAATLGGAALAGEPGPFRDSLVYAAALVLHHLGIDSLAGAAARARRVLDDGSARRHFAQGLAG